MGAVTREGKGWGKKEESSALVIRDRRVIGEGLRDMEVVDMGQDKNKSWLGIRGRMQGKSVWGKGTRDQWKRF